MANKRRGEGLINIGGRERKLKITLNDLAELQDMFQDAPLMKILAELDVMNIKVIRALLYVSLRSDDPELTPEQVGSWDMDLVSVMDILGEVLNNSLGTGKKPGKK